MSPLRRAIHRARSGLTNVRSKARLFGCFTACALSSTLVVVLCLTLFLVWAALSAGSAAALMLLFSDLPI